MTGINACKIGFLSVGLEAYWNQFPGLKERLERYSDLVYHELKRIHPEVIHAGLIDNNEKAIEAGRLFRREEADIIFLYIPTYCLSANVLPAVIRLNIPVILLNLSPEASIDYISFNALSDRTKMTGDWLANCSSCSVPELISVFRRASIAVQLITGLLQENQVWHEVSEWVESARVAFVLRNTRLGCMGHYYNGMLDVYTDLTQLNISFGAHLEMVEVDELSALRKKVTEAEINNRISLFREQFEIHHDSNELELKRAAITSVALDELVSIHRLDALAYYYKGSGNTENEETMGSIIVGNSMLTARGIPVAGEYEIKNALAMKIMDSFHAGGSFTEFYAMDYNEDIVLMGHDGPGHTAISEGKIKVKPLYLYHGKTGNGLSVEMSVKNGPVTLLSLVQQPGGEFLLLVAEGEVVEGPILEIGNTNSRYRFPIGARNFVNSWCLNGPAHHCAVGLGHIASKIHKLGKILGLPVNQVC